MVLVAQNTGYYDRSSVKTELCAPYGSRNALLVVPAVKNHGRIAVQNLEASFPAYVGKPGAECFFAYFQSASVKDTDSLDYRCRVFRLIGSGKRNPDVLIIPVGENRAVDAVFHVFQLGKILFPVFTAAAFSRFRDDFFCIGGAPAEKHRGMRLDYPGFFTGYRRYRVSEKLDMIKRNSGNDREERRGQNVC